MVKPYTAVALQTSIWGILKREDTKKNIEFIAKCVKRVEENASLEYPMKLIALHEASIQGFTDEFFHWDHVTSTRKLMAELPGEETDMLGEIAKQHGCYIIAQLRAKDPEFPDRYFNVAFILDQKGKILLKHRKLQLWANEPSLTPHDVWDRWIELHGDDLDAFFPVADIPEIGRIGCIICMEGSFPEIARGLAMNGAEILYRPTYVEPYLGAGWWELQNRARALDNSCYVVAPNKAHYYNTLQDTVPIDTSGGHSMIVDYRGNVLSKITAPVNSFACATIDIEALRKYRCNSLFGNFLADLRTEIYKKIYEKPIWPKNLFLVEPPPMREELRELKRQSIRRLVERGIWKEPEKSSRA